MKRLFSLPLFLLGCTTERGVAGECITATLASELGELPTECPGALPEAFGKADGRGTIDSPGLRFLRARSESELAALFARGRADVIPSGRNTGTPLLLGLDWLAPALSQIYVGSIWEPVGESSG